MLQIVQCARYSGFGIFPNYLIALAKHLYGIEPFGGALQIDKATHRAIARNCNRACSGDIGNRAAATFGATPCN